LTVAKFLCLNAIDIGRQEAAISLVVTFFLWIVLAAAPAK
jgi:hypothetical protein